MKNPAHYLWNLLGTVQRRFSQRLMPLMLMALAGIASNARAGFHLWDVSEVYSSEDGSVQFVEIRAQFGGQQFMSFGANISSANSDGTSTYSCTTDLPSDTTGKTCVFGTANLETIPGGVKPDYIIPANFIRRPVNGGPATVTFGPSGSTINCASLPSDGRGAVLLSAGNSIVTSTNSPVNFKGDANSIVPVKIDSFAKNGGNVVLSFATATGPNHTAGSNYAVEAKSDVVGSWTTVSNVTGNGTVKALAFPATAVSNQFFRLRVP
jgi:hypothetical protein